MVVWGRESREISGVWNKTKFQMVIMRKEKKTFSIMFTLMKYFTLIQNSTKHHIPPLQAMVVQK